MTIDLAWTGQSRSSMVSVAVTNSLAWASVGTTLTATPSFVATSVG